MSPTTERAVFLILGATGGIGSALARRLAKGGGRLALAARTPEPLEILAHETGGWRPGYPQNIGRPLGIGERMMTGTTHQPRITAPAAGMQPGVDLSWRPIEYQGPTGPPWPCEEETQ
jgi:NAD(P)-dependent dehydrogenase (short-subunit alcohol dehydrogenase family)